MKILFSILFFLSTAWANPPRGTPLSSKEIIYNPGGNDPHRTIISYKDYEDIRIDSNLDGRLDFWHLKKGNIIVEMFFDGGEIKSFYVRRLYQNYVAEFHYVKNGTVLTLAQARTRNHFEMGYSVCESDLKVLKQKLGSFGEEASEKISRDLIKENLIDPSCEASLGEDGIKNLTKQVYQKLRLTNDDLRECFDTDDFKKVFSKSENPSLSVEILKAAYDLQKRQLSEQSQNFKPTFICKDVDKTEDERGYKVARTDEWGKITIFNPTQSKKPTITSSHINHELLHRIGIFDESTIHKIVSSCQPLGSRQMSEQLKNKIAETTYDASIFHPGNVEAASLAASSEQTAVVDPASKQTAGSTTDKSVVAPKKGVEVARSTGNSSVTAAVAKDSSANIPAKMTVAQTSVPSGEVLSTSISNPQPRTDAGAQAAYKTSVSQSSGVLQTANNLAGSLSTRAEASAKAVSNTKEVASAAYAAESKSVLTGRAPTVGALTARNKIGANETIVESITIDDGNNAVVTTGGNNSRLPANTGSVTNLRNTSSTSTAAKAKESPAETAGSGDGGFAQASVNPERASLSGSSGGAGVSIPRQPANIRRGNATATTSSQSVTQDEVVTFISKSDYSATKKKLSDKKFTDQLVEQKITILDTYGNTYGALKGDVIFLDRGNRFVRQK